MKIINDMPSEDIIFKDLKVGDTFLFRYSDTTYDKEDIYLRINDITNSEGVSINALHLKCNCGVNFSEKAIVKKIDCVVKVVSM